VVDETLCRPTGAKTSTRGSERLAGDLNLGLLLQGGPFLNVIEFRNLTALFALPAPRDNGRLRKHQSSLYAATSWEFHRLTGLTALDFHLEHYHLYLHSSSAWAASGGCLGWLPSS
jgi:hypothetical protein